MKFTGKILLTIVLLLLMAVVATYLLMQTRWGSSWISRAVSEHTEYQIAFSKLEHHFSNPTHFTLNNVSFGFKTQPAIVVAKKVDVVLSRAQFSSPLHFAIIQLENGTLNLNSNGQPLPLSADRLQLNQMILNRPGSKFPLVAKQVDGGILPWYPEVGDFIGNDTRFQISAGALEVNGIAATNVLLQGTRNHNQLVINNLGADVAMGSVTTSAQCDAQGNWLVSALRLNNIRLQSRLSISDLLAPLASLPSVHFDRIDVTDARLEGKDWAVTDLDLALKNITLNRGSWESKAGSLSMNASTFVNGSLELNDPIANLTFSPEGIALKQFSSRWVNGLIRTSGRWARDSKKLTLDELAVAGLEYTLPLNWRERWMATLPEWLDSVEVTKFVANRNLIIDINPDFPFQLTSLEGNGNHLLIARNHQWGVWSGDLSFNAAEATFNRVDVRHPSMSLNAGNNSINVTEMSAFTHDGMLESLATLSQQPERRLSLTLNGRNVPVNLLHDWGWPTVPLTGDGHLQLKIQSSLAAGVPLKSATNGTLAITAGDKTLQQTMNDGLVAGAQ
ncbi:AsmA family protein [Erwinia psidii]|uniref:AsmA family protein n=1 Tax=Erwinia psidii TaxID=69224 RepID=A0A3N6S8J2_9GAMM|nr:AsmA family protein [Erwinia psidii]MCX8959550.1 AsmA family protein [Erwinia psidii]MCX8963197.1 AsmA family protein [Erwinia psidii]RQM36443.1 AsmA family protein [Erwinia psidii]